MTAKYVLHNRFNQIAKIVKYNPQYSIYSLTIVNDKGEEDGFIFDIYEDYYINNCSLYDSFDEAKRVMYIRSIL